MGDSLAEPCDNSVEAGRRQSDIPRSDRQGVFLLLVHGLRSLMTVGGSDSKVDYTGNRGLFRAPGNQIHPLSYKPALSAASHFHDLYNEPYIHYNRRHT